MLFRSPPGRSVPLIAPDGERALTATQLGRELLELVRPAAEELGSTELLDVLDPATCEADRQRAHATPLDATADLVARSLA